MYVGYPQSFRAASLGGSSRFVAVPGSTTDYTSSRFRLTGTRIYDTSSGRASQLTLDNLL
jgi:hypothetical protein